MASNTQYVHRVVGKSNVMRLRKRGFTVGGAHSGSTITGGTDGLLAKLLPGGKAQVQRLKKLGIRA